MTLAAMQTSAPEATRADRLFDEHQDQLFRRAGRIFAPLMVIQWVFGILIAVTFSPYGWAGKVKSIHVHVYAAVLLGAVISSAPLLLSLTRPTWVVTRHVVAIAQMLWSALLIHLTGGRIETHFHVFVSLAFLAFLYRDWRVLVPATLVVVSDHFVRGLLWPESVYGVVNPEWWRFLEHAFWVAFEDAVLVIACVASVREMRDVARHRAEVEGLAAAVGHELRNPLAAVRNATTYISKRLTRVNGGAPPADPRILQFVELADRELETCNKIITNLLDFSRHRPLSVGAWPLRELVDEASSILPPTSVMVVNDVPADLPAPLVDKDQFRQVLVNVIQNAVEATGQNPTSPGRIVISANGGGDGPWRIRVADDGPGVSREIADKIFEPLFTTKTKGTGLGLAIVARIVEAHQGSIRLDSTSGRGTSFVIELPRARAEDQEARPTRRDAKAELPSVSQAPGRT